MDCAVAIVVKKGTFKSRLNQMIFKLIGQLGHLRHQMIMAYRSTRGFPDMLLRVQLRSGHGKIKRLQPWMGFQKLAYHTAFMPAGTIPEEHDVLGGKGGQDLLQMLH